MVERRSAPRIEEVDRAGRASEPSDAAWVREPGRDTTHMEAHLVPHDRPVDGRHDMAVDLAALPSVGPAAPLPEPDGL